MWKPLQDRERGLSGSPLSFTKAAYVAALPTLRMEGDLRHHRGCVNHISFSESGVSLLLSLLVPVPYNTGSLRESAQMLWGVSLFARKAD